MRSLQMPAGGQLQNRRRIGKPVRRREDPRLLTGGGRFADDLSLPSQTYAYMVRSPHAHARIASIDIGAAGEMSGVIAVLTGKRC